MLNRQRGLPLAPPHCGSHCHRLGVCLTLQFLWRQLFIKFRISKGDANEFLAAIFAFVSADPTLLGGE